MALTFDRIPPNAKIAPSRFQVAIPDQDLSDFQQLLHLSKIAPETYENTLSDDRYGISRQWLIDAKVLWEKFDWRENERYINSFPHFKLPIQDIDDIKLDIHFVALFSQKPDAIPLIFLHGWPGSFLEFLPILRLFMDEYGPDNLPYHIIVPSCPGYAFSSPPPLQKNFEIQDVARVMNTLMETLGFGSGYLAQGGDVGSKIARVLAVEHAACRGVHINFCIMPEPEGVDSSKIDDLERQGLDRTAVFLKLGSSYALQHATKRSTIGLALSASPLSLLAWIAEKFLQWSDEDPPISTILESVTLYWLTGTFPRSIYPYRQLFTPGNIGAHENPKWYVRKPFGYSYFPMELAPIPRLWAATTGNLVFFRQHVKGGHFAALECPEILKKDVEEFVSQVWQAQ
ncbi:Alpha/Beta hydrolase protein [Xylogone sp. PMI_703]|nr:Alpha/Beta hydrolase protein [Xylogone sp. PMI_703]